MLGVEYLVSRKEPTGPRRKWTRKARELWTPRERELFEETPHSLPVDFHSFRRAFNTALADAGVNIQTAMRLAGHADAATHMRSVMSRVRRVPEAALPRLRGASRQPRCLIGDIGSSQAW